MERNTVVCPICGAVRVHLFTHIQTDHQLTTSQFKKLYPQQRMRAKQASVGRGFWENHIEKLEGLRRWYPHWGRNLTSQEIGVPAASVMRKAHREGLRLLPREHRICYRCRNKKVAKDVTRGYYCDECFPLKHHDYVAKVLLRNPVVGRLKWLFSSLRQRGHIVDIDVEYLIQLWDEQQGLCPYTGIPMTAKLNIGDGRRSPTAISIDRIDSAVGYVRGNVRLASWWANCAKNTLNQNELVEWCQALVNTANKKIGAYDTSK